MSDSPFKKNWLKVTGYLKSQCRDGWWPYRPGQSPSIEATSWCALAVAGYNGTASQVAAFLIKAQNQDGGWSNTSEPDVSDWSTAPALLALAAMENHIPSAGLKADLHKSIDDGFSYLLGSRTEFYTTPVARAIVSFLQGQEALEYPRGWPWTRGCFHWVEPTSYALMAIKLSKQAAAHSATKDAVAKAQDFLLKNSCAAGGWNHGNSLCLSVNLPPFTVTTAEALIALQDRSREKIVQNGIKHLEAVADGESSIMGLSWCALALNIHGADVTPLISRLVKQQNKDGSFADNMFLSALACLALASVVHDNPLKFTSI